ncbi:mini-chromosome maintenance complex-binding protein [Daktulosphaira vitifoliae]|uniref:mini-chromosome maintenance complex-binding protein n=1 Tax=Daktulosphaira vitifoliae TaxID=58002 RepID=UPI0021AAC3C2|nr:mini-chromosome maintenance complex-binding protein [Daktulosphaira vitifoliae]
MINWTSDYYNENKSDCQKILKTPENWEKVPLLFDHQMPKGSLVRFKGMIQDMLNPEYYSKTFSISNSMTNETRVFQGKFHCSISNLKPEEEINFDDVLLERHIVACIPIPGLNSWVKNVENLNDIDKSQLEGNFPKRFCFDPSFQNNKKEVIVFVYPEDTDSNFLKVNHIIDIVGFLDLRSLQYGKDEYQEKSHDLEEQYCIHALHIKFQPISIFCKNQISNESIWKEASSIHNELKLILTQALLGDSLAADYLIFNLISTIYNRQNNQVPGKFSLNIHGIPKNAGNNYINKLYSLISLLVEKSEYLSITIQNMNNINMIPRKCYIKNRLINGLLQLSKRTHLIIDETNLEPGKLENKGMLNLQALNDIICNQQIKYDFTYYTIDYETEISVLTLSIGKSLLPYDVNILLKPDPSCIENIKETVDSAINYLNSQYLLLEKLRKYIGIITSNTFNYSEDILKVIENDYVNMRKIDPKNVSADDLHRYMVISKLIALSSGENDLNIDIWEKCKGLEAERKLRN